MGRLPQCALFVWRCGLVVSLQTIKKHNWTNEEKRSREGSGGEGRRWEEVCDLQRLPILSLVCARVSTHCRPD